MLPFGESGDYFVVPHRGGPNPFLQVDPGIIDILPAGATVTALVPCGSSFWTQTARLDIKLAPAPAAPAADGALKSYFLKVARGDHGRAMMEAEMESMAALHAAAADFVPRPCGWGPYRDLADVYFFLSEFQDVVEEMPEVDGFVSSVARLHSTTESPTGRYGFHITTYVGPLPQDNGWCDTWEDFFAQGMRRMMAIERDVHGPSDELDRLAGRLYERVIPRLLRPLAVLKSIKPVLLHGDMWYANCCTDVGTERPLVFDPSSFYGHNEYEMGTWRATRYRFCKTYIRAYQKNFPPAAPEEDHGDRNALYSIRSDIHSSCTYYTSIKFRRDFMATIKMLVDKYPEGYDGWERDNADLIAAAG